MTLIVGNVVDVGLRGLDGALRVWAWFRPEEVGLIAPYRREWEIRQGEIEPGVDVVPGPAVVEVDCGPDAYTSVEVTVPDAESVALKDLFEQVYSYTPGVVSEAWEARRGAEAAALEAELSAGEAGVSAGRALTSEGAAALHAATLSARVEQPGQDILYTSDGKPYFADPAQIENVPLTVDTSVGTRVMLGDQMIYGDTGLRRLTVADFMNGWSTLSIPYVYLRRIGSTVSFEIPELSLTGVDATSDRAYKIPEGFKPIHGYNVIGSASVGASPSMIAIRTSLGDILLPARDRIAGFFTWQTSNPWPASLPGIPY